MQTVRFSGWSIGGLSARKLGLVLMLASLLLLALRGRVAPAHAQVSRQSLSFNARVTRQQVVNRDVVRLERLQVVDMDLDGILTLDGNDDGQLRGVLTLEDGTVIPVTGTSTGAAVSLVVTVSPDQVWFATGTMTTSPRDGTIAAGAGSMVVLTPTGPAVGYWMMCGEGVPLCPEG